MSDNPEDGMKATPEPVPEVPPVEAPAPAEEECKLCEVTCKALGDGSEGECKTLFKQLGANEITDETFQTRMTEKFGPGWGEKVFDELEKVKGQMPGDEE